jgi:hypothetical protein
MADPAHPGTRLPRNHLTGQLKAFRLFDCFKTCTLPAVDSSQSWCFMEAVIVVELFATAALLLSHLFVVIRNRMARDM